MIWYVIGLLAVTWAINYLVLLYGFDGLTYYLTTEAKDYEIGEEIPITSVVENNRLMLVSYLRVEESFPPHFSVAKNVYSLFVLPWQRVKRTYKIQGQKRGLHRITQSLLELGDFVGFSSEERRVTINQSLVILPKQVRLAESLVPLGPLGGEITVKRWIIDDPLMIIGIRDYTGNEPQRFIHWPSSAKFGSLMVKKLDFTSDNSVLVILNVEASRSRWQPIEEELIDAAVSLARGVLEEFEELKVPYGLVTNAYNDQSGNWGYQYHAGLGAGHLGALLHTLGSMHFRVPGLFENTLADIRRTMGNYTTAVIVTPRLIEPYLEPINRLARAVPCTVVIAVEGDHMDALSGNIIKYRGNHND